MPQKLPWFPLDVDDFLSSQKVQTMSLCELGVYIKLLCYAWRDDACSIPQALLKQCKLVGATSEEEVAAVREVTSSCFIQHPDFTTSDNRLTNERLLSCRKAQLDRYVKYSARAKNAAEKRWKKGDANSMLDECLEHAKAMPQTSISISNSISTSNSKNKNKTETPEKPEPKLYRVYQTDDGRGDVWLTRKEVQTLKQRLPEKLIKSGFESDAVTFRELVEDFSIRKGDSKYAGRHQSDSRNIQRWGFRALFADETEVLSIRTRRNAISVREQANGTSPMQSGKLRAKAAEDAIWDRTRKDVEAMKLAEQKRLEGGR